MIIGMFTMEDTVISWKVLSAAQVDIIVSNLHADTEYHGTVSCQAFGAAMALAIGGDEFAFNAELYKLAETIMPSDITLRWIP